MANEDGLILNLSFDKSLTPKPVSRTSLKKQYLIEGGSKYERQLIRKAIRDQRDKELGIDTVRNRNTNDPNELPLGKKHAISSTALKQNIGIVKSKRPLEFTKKGDTSLAAQFRKKKKLESELSGEVQKKMIKKVYKEKREGEDGNSFVSSLFNKNDLHQIEKDFDNDIADNLQVIKNEPSNAPLKGSDLTFEGLGIETSLTNILQKKMGLSIPTKIQRAVIPRMLNGIDNDLFVQAQTGSGKTLAYSLPIFQRLLRQSISDNNYNGKLSRSSGIFGIILAPTRELAAQIYNVLEMLHKGCYWIVPGIVSGGEKKKSEKARIRKGVNILVATPGRLADHIDSTESLDLSFVRWLVLDECDRLMELGFEETIDKILKALDEQFDISNSKTIFPLLPKKRVNILCSATVKGKVKELGETSLTNAEWVTVNSLPTDSHEMIPANEINEIVDNSSSYTAPAQLIQRCIIVPAKLRLVTLAATLRNTVRKRILKSVIKQEEKISRVIVFFSCSDSVDFHFSVFTRNGVDPKKEFNQSDKPNEVTRSLVSSTVLTSPWLGKNTVIHKLHGSLNQATRTSTLASFFGKAGKSQANKNNDSKVFILFCTDVASRGLDLPRITDVIEYDPPFATEDHIHRVGRTARAGHEGTSVIFLLPGSEEAYLNEIKPYHPSGIQNEKYDIILRKAFAEEESYTNNSTLNWEVEATTWHLNVERWILADNLELTKAKRAFTSHIRAYATHLASQRGIFNLKGLHLGHLAKSFGLRETPGKLSTVKDSVNKSDKKKVKYNKPNFSQGKHHDEYNSFTGQDSEAAGKKRLLSKARSLNNFRSQANEFNIG
ncbi:uncharacterized protein SAPINGB_P003331 [Magnusiomyces paraingens]|uniref:ATP-dependent RNA helicase n=1 Tax=Magnusiomyces paraingens TaxID=2606893 RepID=A0A5E8BW84_9ASCO|nr:uncharacterized protein SAPINGB_P003331 [Saprochaete ingens]VVT52955.1 unnamed protein product [Saprochaete ingens]